MRLKHIWDERNTVSSRSNQLNIDCDLCAHILATKQLRRPATVAQTIAPMTKCIRNKHNWLRIRDDYRFIHKMMRQRTNAGHILKQWINSIPFIIRFEWNEENRISKSRDAIESKRNGMELMPCDAMRWHRTQFMTTEIYLHYNTESNR